MKEISIYLLILLMHSCSTSHHFQGVFKSSISSKFIFLNKDSTFEIIDSTQVNGANDRQCKLVSFGNWELDNKKFIVINSEYTPLHNYFIDSIIASKNIESDSIFFTIDLSIQPEEKQYFSYSLDINYEGEYEFKEEFSKPFQTNQIQLKAPLFGVKIKSIVVQISYKRPFSNFIEPYLGVETISTIEKEVSDHNFYHIKIPIDFCYFESERYKEEYIKILNKDKLFWNGEEYLRYNPPH
jgi:hypothetical protein